MTCVCVRACIHVFVVILCEFKNPCPMSRFVPRPSFLTGVLTDGCSDRVNRLSDGRDITVSAGWLANSPCPLNQLFLRTSVSSLTYIKRNGLVDTGLKDPETSRCSTPVSKSDPWVTFP